ncbi:MAG: hypothetical protein WCK09_21995, partial [Bacteroidota bacterium]
MKKILHLKALMVMIIMLCSMLGLASTLNVPGTYPTIQAAVTAAVPNDIILIAPGTYPVTSNIPITVSNLTITGSGIGSTFITCNITAGTYLFSVTAPGFTLQNVEMIKTDKNGEQDLIWINANNVSILNNSFHGQFVIGDGDVSRAMVISGGLSGLLINSNTFYALRQPMYLTGTTTGTISNNNTYGTKGWVLEGGNVTFTGNTWGTGAQANVYDIAILGTCPAIYHTDIVAIANANNDAVIEDQRVSPAVLSVVYVDNSTSYTTDLGGRFHPYPAIAPSLTRVVAGGKIFVTAGTYSEYLTVSKSCKMFGSNAGRHPAVGTHPTETVNPRYPETILNNLVPAADNIQIDGFKFLKAGTRIIDTYANANNFVLKNCIVESTIYGTTTGIIQFGGGSHTGCVFEFNLFKDKGDHTFYAGGGPYDNLVFQYNKFQSNNDAIFWASTPLIGGVIDHNEFDGENGANYNNINIGQAGNIQITNNWFHGILYTAIQCGILNGSISGNKFETHYGLAGYNAAAIQLWGGEYGTAVSSNVAITNNEIHYNQNGVSPVFGIRLRGPNSPSEPKIDGSTIHVHNNAFYNGGVRADAYAILFQGDLTTTVDATCNWWASEGTPLVYQAPTFTGPVTYIPYSVSNGGACVGGLATVTVQAPAQLSSCGNFDVNLTAKNFTNVGAISLYLNFNPLVFEYLPAGVTLNAKISSAVVTTTIQGKFILSWTSGNLGVNFDPDEVLCTLHFKLL